jgi:site-specific DNA recombinase
MSQRVAVYARFSTNRQNESSLEEQVRACTDYATRQQWAVVKAYDDKGISGAALGNRPGIQLMQADAAAGAFDVLLVTDLSRLSRNQGDLPKLIMRLTQRRIRVIGVQDGTDTARKGYKLQVGVSGIVGEAFREMVKERTALSLRLRAEQGYHTGGVSYGYVSVAVDPAEPNGYKRLQIEESRAATVRRIFQLYADGASPRGIAASLNDESVPSPGAKWKRTRRRTDGRWLASSVLSILGNELYTGHVVHGRRQFVKDDDSGVRSASAPTELVIERHEEWLRIISDELWQRVKARQNHRSRIAGAKVRAGFRRRCPGGGRTGKYLLSGLLKCAACKASFVLSNGTRYQCSSHHDGGPGACDLSLSVPRVRVEGVIKGFIEDELLDTRRLLEIGERYRAAEASAIAVDYGPRIAELEQEIRNITDFIAKGHGSDALAARLKAAEAERDRPPEGYAQQAAHAAPYAVG